MSTLQERLCALVADQLRQPPEKVVPEANLIEDLDADSLDIVDHPDPQRPVHDDQGRRRLRPAVEQRAALGQADRLRGELRAGPGRLLEGAGALPAAAN